MALKSNGTLWWTSYSFADRGLQSHYVHIEGQKVFIGTNFRLSGLFFPVRVRLIHLLNGWKCFNVSFLLDVFIFNCFISHVRNFIQLQVAATHFGLVFHIRFENQFKSFSQVDFRFDFWLYKNCFYDSQKHLPAGGDWSHLLFLRGHYRSYFVTVTWPQNLSQQNTVKH